jgi:hypothetical protein
MGHVHTCEKELYVWGWGLPGPLTSPPPNVFICNETFKKKMGGGTLSHKIDHMHMYAIGHARDSFVIVSLFF